MDSTIPPQPDPASQPRRAGRWTFLAFGFLLAVQAVFLALQRNPYFEDDAAFYLRYADNLAAGHGMRWNAEEPPVWGASAPLWPLLLAVGELAGPTAAEAARAWSWMLTLAATGLLGLAAWRVRGEAGVLALAPLVAINHLYSTWGLSGMESPLTYFAVAAALAAVAGGAGGTTIGLAAGLCLVHKVDLAPFGACLLAGTFVWRRDAALRASLVALAIAGAWYGFAAWYFGSPLPNSFRTKLHSSYGNLTAGWFTANALFHGGNAVRSVLGLVGLYVLRRRPFLAALAVVQVAIPCVAYALKPPSEPFMWYVSATAPSLSLLAAVGAGRILTTVAGAPVRVGRAAAAAALLVALGVWLAAVELPRAERWHGYLSWIEPTRIQAGEWVAANTPPEVRVMTAWGNPAYHSRRFVYDASSLNRPPEPGVPLLRYEPEVWIDATFEPLADYRPTPPYRIVKTFTKANYGHEFSAIVLFHPALLGDDSTNVDRFVASLRRKVEGLVATGEAGRAAAARTLAAVERGLARIRAQVEALGSHRPVLARSRLEQLERVQAGVLELRELFARTGSR